MSDPAEKKLTPMLAQYRDIKARYPDAIVLFRLGDFYETFDADARVAARELELALTGRSFAKGVRLAMAGVPHHHVQAYIAKLIDKGYKVALVEQLEDPKKVKKLVKRDVVRVITPGTVVEDALLRAKSENFLAAIVRVATEQRGRGVERRGSKGAEEIVSPPHPRTLAPLHAFGLALVDISTGEFATTQIDGADAETTLLDELQRVQPSEYVLPQSLADDVAFVARLKAIRPARVSPIENRAAQHDDARRELLAHFRVKTLAPFGCEELPLAMSAAGAALYYLTTNQPSSEPASHPLQHLTHLWTFSLADYMTLDAATRRNLELTSPIHADVGAGLPRPYNTRSLFAVLDHTVTAMGARLLKRWVTQPLLDLARIHARLDAVEQLNSTPFLRDDLRKLLDGLYDVERLVGRIGFGNANARDLMALKRTLTRLPKIRALLVGAEPPRPDVGAASGAETAPLLPQLGANLDELQDVASLIESALVEDPPIFIRDGGLVKRGYDATLDALRETATSEKNWLNELEERERKRTGIKNLRVRYNEVFGFFIEAPRSAAKLIPKDYERRATISHAERYVTPELKAKEATILATEDRVNDLEYELFVGVRRAVAEHSARLQSAARILAQVDALCALAEAAARYSYVKPVVDDGDALEIREGRHPVVERFLRDDEAFVPNDARLDHETQRVIILTGPNMSGKSVFIRQVALIVLMAQMGSFVPASSARVGLVDRIFTRVGASDDIAQGRSTFLVEMSETSYILRHATARSLIVLDEVGRGTSTYDGISLAWAIAEEIHDQLGAKTLFATHYHELTQLAVVETLQSPSRAHGRDARSLPNAIRNYTMAVKERGNEVIFLRQVIAGGAEKSFGIHVAQLAGLHARIIDRANEVLRRLESEREANATGDGGRETEANATGDEGRRTDEYALPSSVSRLLSAVIEERTIYDARDAWREVVRELATVDIANLTPVQALVWLNAMQLRIKEIEAPML